jgi:hypothetical protein
VNCQLIKSGYEIFECAIFFKLGKSSQIMSVYFKTCIEILAKLCPTNIISMEIIIPFPLFPIFVLAHLLILRGGGGGGGVNQYRTTFNFLQYLSIYYFNIHKKLMINVHTNIQSIKHKYLTWKPKWEKTTKLLFLKHVGTNLLLQYLQEPTYRRHQYPQLSTKSTCRHQPTIAIFVDTNLQETPISSVEHQLNNM